MSDQTHPELIMAVNLWSLTGHPSFEDEWNLDQKLKAIKEGGCDAFSGGALWGNQANEFKLLGDKYDLRFAGAFDADSAEKISEAIEASLAVDNGPMNCQLGDHDTPIQEAVDLTIALMKTAEKLNADVYLEMHRDTCTETPEKTYAIIDGYEKATGKRPKVNFDYSHPAIVKHLNPNDYVSRLIERPDILQEASLLHIRPFNGHHCQIPVTDGSGGLSLEFQSFRPFAYELFKTWLKGKCPGNALWVVPELGPVGKTGEGYGLSSFPNIFEDTIVLAKELRLLWEQALQDVGPSA